MTADERIEALVSRFGQTIEDLPGPGDYGYFEKGDRLINSMRSALDTAVSWFKPESPDDDEEAMEAYICHLCDVIDRMEAALETATLVMDCGFCDKWNCDGPHDCSHIARVRDTVLVDDEIVRLHDPDTDEWDDEMLDMILGIKEDAIHGE